MPLVRACRCGGAWTRCKSNTGDFDSFDDYASKEKDTRCNFADQMSQGISDGVEMLKKILEQQLKPVTDIIGSLKTLGENGLMAAVPRKRSRVRSPISSSRSLG
jgi:hypothetical protein